MYVCKEHKQHNLFKITNIFLLFLSPAFILKKLLKRKLFVILNKLLFSYLIYFDVTHT